MFFYFGKSCQLQIFIKTGTNWLFQVVPENCISQNSLQKNTASCGQDVQTRQILQYFINFKNCLCAKLTITFKLVAVCYYIKMKFIDTEHIGFYRHSLKLCSLLIATSARLQKLIKILQTAKQGSNYTLYSSRYLIKYIRLNSEQGKAAKLLSSHKLV